MVVITNRNSRSFRRTTTITPLPSTQGHTHVKQQIVNPHETETSGRSIAERSTELANQQWDRGKSAALAESEGIGLSDAHWSVIVFLREYYLEHGLPINARTTARALNKNFVGQGGNKYLRRLFSEGPVTQGSRLSNLRTPAYATDPSFGTSY
jgi:tRNA 2-thiouridine synthesizing protein E